MYIFNEKLIRNIEFTLSLTRFNSSNIWYEYRKLKKKSNKQYS